MMRKNNNEQATFTIDALAQLVAQQVAAEINRTNTAQNTQATPIVYDDANHWAMNSRFKNQEICGFMYNPYMVRRFLPAQYMDLYRAYNTNVHKGISNRYTYNYAVEFTVSEIKKLAMLEKRDRIAFNERSKMFDLKSCKAIMCQYYTDLLECVSKTIYDLCTEQKLESTVYVKFYGAKRKTLNVGKVVEAIIDHKVAHVIEFSSEYKKFKNSIVRTKNEINECKSFDALNKVTQNLTLFFVKNMEDHNKSKDFMNCFIKSGAYYTLKNMIMFDGASFHGLTGREAVSELMHLALDIEGYKVHAMLKEVKGDL